MTSIRNDGLMGLPLWSFHFLIILTTGFHFALECFVGSGGLLGVDARVRVHPVSESVVGDNEVAILAEGRHHIERDELVRNVIDDSRAEVNANGAAGNGHSVVAVVRIEYALDLVEDVPRWLVSPREGIRAQHSPTTRSPLRPPGSSSTSSTSTTTTTSRPVTSRVLATRITHAASTLDQHGRLPTNWPTPEAGSPRVPEPSVAPG